jgi:hypothetical protein
MDKIAVKDKPGKCKGVDPATYQEFKNDPDAMLTAGILLSLDTLLLDASRTGAVATLR